MKKFLTIFAVAALALTAVVSCKDKEDEETTVDLKGISLSEASLNLGVGEEATLTVKYTPENATNKPKATWTSSNEEVASVSEGKVTALAAGETTITATVEKFTATCTVKVTEEPVDLNGAWGVTGGPWKWGEVEDTPMTATSDGWYEVKGVALTVGDEFKFRRDKGWDINFGLPKDATFEEGVEFAVEQGGANLKAPKSGEFTLSLNPNKALAKVVCTKESEEKPDYNGTWSVIGVGGNWDTDAADLTVFESEGQKYYQITSITLAVGDEFKFRMDHDWNINFGVNEGDEALELSAENIATKELVRGGKNIKVTVAGDYAIIFSPDMGIAAFELVSAPTPEGKIKIDGDFSDWAEIGGVSNGTHGLFKLAVDDYNLYIYSLRTKEGRYSEIWGAKQGYIYLGLNLDGDDTTGESLWGNGPYEFVGVFYPYGATEGTFVEAPGDACMPETATLAHAKAAGAVTDAGAIVEIAVPLADLPALPEAFTAFSWGNKDLAKVEYAYPYEAPQPEEPKEMVPFNPENFAAIDWSNKEAATWYYFQENYALPDGFTFILHIYPNSLNTAGMRVGNFGSNDADPSPCNMLRFGQNGDNAELEWMVDHAGGRSQKELLAKGFVAEKWQAIVLTADKATGSYKIYRNAELGAEKTFSYNDNMKFGAIEFANSWGASWRSAFNGRMALLSVYNRALTADEIAQNIFTTPVSDACVGFWPMNDGEGGILAADQSRAIKEQIDLTKAVRNDNDNTTQNHEFDATPYITWTTGNKIEKEEPAPVVLSVSEFIALEDNTEATFSGIVAAVGTNGSVITDGQKNIYVFKPATKPAIGDKVTVKAVKTTYYGLIETKQGGELTIESSGNAVPRTEIVDITANFDDYPNNAPTSDYIQVKGTVAISGNYSNLNVAGAVARQGSLQGLSVKDYDGKVVVLKGYYVGTSGTGGKFVTLVVTDVTPVATDGSTGEDLGGSEDVNPWN